MLSDDKVLPDIERVAALVHEEDAPDALPYLQLPEHVKDQIRKQVRAIYDAIEEVWSYDESLEEDEVETEQEKKDAME